MVTAGKKAQMITAECAAQALWPHSKAGLALRDGLKR
jgi:hypothetical protein